MTASAKARRARALLDDAGGRGVAVVALGGVAIEMLCESARPERRWSRELADIDVATTLGQRAAAERLIVDHGFAADESFNRMNGSVRLRYADADGSHLDVFLDELRLCHVVSWRRDLHAGMTTLPLAALVLTKLQIVALEVKDETDLAALLTDAWEPLLEAWPEVERRVARDWGLWRTARGNLAALSGSRDALVAGRSRELLERFDAVSHTPKARVRALVGERVRWYEEPEEV